MVRGEHHVGLAAVQLDGLGQVPGPGVRVSDHRAAQRQQVVQVVRRVLGGAERALVREVEVHLRRRLGAGGELEDDPHPVDHFLLAGARDVQGGRDQRDRSGRGGQAEPGADLPGRAPGQLGAVHVDGAPGHRSARVDVLADRVLQEPGRGDDRDAGALGHHPAHAAEVVTVRVGVDDRRHRPVAAVLTVQAKGRGRALGRDQRVDDDDARVALDERDVRQVKATDLVDPVGDLEQPLLGAKLALPPQAGVGGIGARRVEERVRVAVPYHPAVSGLDHSRRQRGDEPALRVVEVGPVVERRQCGHDVPPGA